MDQVDFAMKELGFRQERIVIFYIANYIIGVKQEIGSEEYR